MRATELLRAIIFRNAQPGDPEKATNSLKKVTKFVITYKGLCDIISKMGSISSDNDIWRNTSLNVNQSNFRNENTFQKLRNSRKKILYKMKSSLL